MRRCREDQEEANDDNGDDNSGISSDEEEDLERGVSGAMANVFDPELRIRMLLVHGMLHLVGYDHETDEDYELMVSREEDILRQLGMPLPLSRT